MAITSSGEISIADIMSEFSLYAPASVSGFYGIDPWLPVPYEGEISLSDFYTADKNTTRVICDVGRLGSTSTDASGRFGFGYYKGSGHAYSTGETGNHTYSFGSLQRNIYFSTGKRMEAFYSAIYGRPKAWIYLTTRHSVNTGFTKLSVRFNNVSNHYGDPFSSETTTNADAEYEVDLTRTGADYFGVVPNSYISGVAAYYWAWDCTAYTDHEGVQYALESAAKGNHYAGYNTGGVSVKLFT